MARHLSLLDATQRRAFDQPPVFNQPQRQLFFALPDWATQFLDMLLAPHSRGDFVLQVGYFMAKQQSVSGGVGLCCTASTSR